MFVKTVDGVLKALNKAITDLEVVAEQQAGIRSKAYAEIELQSAIADNATREIARANRVRERIKELVG